MQKKLLKLVTDLLKQLDIKPTKIDLKQDEEETYQLSLELDEKDTGILIGYHGDTIASLQLILGLMIYKQTGEWTRLVVNVGDYREQKQTSLEKTADDTVRKVTFSGEPIALFNLNPFERRIIHMYLKEHPDVVSESDGEGRNRHLIISPKNPSANQPPPPSDDQAPEGN
jgi:spoIIIJ-associated protein